MAYPGDLRPGSAVIIDGTPFVCVDFDHQKYGRGSATIRLKLKNLKTGAIIDRTFKGKEELEEADVSFEHAQYLYRDVQQFMFMDQTNFEQIGIPAERIGRAAEFLKEGETYELMMIDGAPFSVKLPPKVVLKVVEAEPGVKGDSATNPTKRVKLETGAVIHVPLFVEAGDTIRINTETGEYVERV